MMCLLILTHIIIIIITSSSAAAAADIAEMDGDEHDIEMYQCH